MQASFYEDGHVFGENEVQDLLAFSINWRKRKIIVFTQTGKPESKPEYGAIILR